MYLPAAPTALDYGTERRVVAVWILFGRTLDFAGGEVRDAETDRTVPNSGDQSAERVAQSAVPIQVGGADTDRYGLDVNDGGGVPVKRAQAAAERRAYATHAHRPGPNADPQEVGAAGADT
jgi:hypothetical protein